MEKIFNFILGGVIIGSMLAILALGFTFVIMWWVEVSCSAFICSLPFLMIGGFIGVSEFGENKNK